MAGAPEPTAAVMASEAFRLESTARAPAQPPAADTPKASAAVDCVRVDKWARRWTWGGRQWASPLLAASPSPPDSTRCPCCTTINVAEAEYCDCCSSPLDGGAALGRVVQLAAAGDIAFNALDKATGLTGNGNLVGPGGAPLLGAGAFVGGLSDRELQLAKGISLRAPPVSFFAAADGASGGATVGVAAAPL